MGRNKLPGAKHKLRGNPGKRDLPDELEVSAPSMRCPPGLSKAEKKYWRMWAANLIKVGKLTTMSLPSFMDLIRMKVRLDEVNQFIRDSNQSLVEESKWVDSSGQEHTKFKESTYAKMSRDLTKQVHQLMKSWGLTADSAAGLFRMEPDKTDAERFMDG